MLQTRALIISHAQVRSENLLTPRVIGAHRLACTEQNYRMSDRAIVGDKMGDFSSILSLRATKRSLPAASSDEMR